ncbi:HAD superfamily hydrolase (TIGR01509 family) [Iodobacter fluviatilis]|uniref:HAD superfamily hydrolase (TIGR01509 family) n=2 Tax=Iodobacter fluviatilis TaxID=537 RepID=A0A377Q935_9NEIS|nr:HAD superfamily hydrolase (TIGR01509 family) [Iodobacter fluviatilis]STQ91784.1 Phosphorylated carbohydrates phosphatase TM_1254 [Iodobacter fluviatilis]
MYLTSKPQAALFDMDGLMLDTESIGIECWTAAAASLGTDMPRALIIGMIGMHSGKTDIYLQEHLGRHAPIAELRAACHTLYMERTQEPIAHRPGLTDILDWLEAHHIPKAVCTSTRRSIAEHHLRAAGIWPRFEFAICGDEVTHPKPAPEIYQKAAAAFHLPPESCIVLEDSDFGVQAAHQAGCKIIMIPDLRPPSRHSLALNIPILGSLTEARDLLAQAV